MGDGLRPMPDDVTYGRVLVDVSEFIADVTSDGKPDRRALEGIITFIPSVTFVVDTKTGGVIYTNPEPIELRDDGTLEVMLVANDAPHLNPTGWHYKVRIEPPGKIPLEAPVVVPGGTTSRLGDVIDPTVAVGPGSTQVRGAQGEKGDPGEPGKDGRTPVLTWEGDRIAVDGVVSSPSLTGPEGEPGKPGKDGEDGKPGRDGKDGASSIASSDFEIRGKGSPYGRVTPREAGMYYVDMDGTCGAWRWRSIGNDHLSWVVVDGDTGWRDVSHMLDKTYVTGGTLRLRRVNDAVWIDWNDIATNELDGDHFITEPWPEGFRLSGNFYDAFTLGGGLQGRARFDIIAGTPRLGGPSRNLRIRDLSVKLAHAVGPGGPWPTALPGLKSEG